MFQMVRWLLWGSVEELLVVVGFLNKRMIHRWMTAENKTEITPLTHDGLVFQLQTPCLTL